jgi:hypothetical protein
MLGRLGTAGRAHAAAFAELAAAADAALFGSRIVAVAELAPLHQAAQAIVGIPAAAAATR